MSFSSETKITARAIVRTFETGNPAGDFSAYAVLRDGAGVSYGIGQFTHRSGSLLSVIERYLASGGAIGRRVFEQVLPLLGQTSPHAIAGLARDRVFEKALRGAGLTREMRAAQQFVLQRLYIEPAVAECERLGLTLPLSLAVVCDSFVHGSWRALRMSIPCRTPADGGSEKQWITAYIRKRHAWLSGSPRLAKTTYRTRFFMMQIMTGKWDLELPLLVNGTLLTRELVSRERSATADDVSQYSAAEPVTDPPQRVGDKTPATQNTAKLPAPSFGDTQPPNPMTGSEILERAEAAINRAARNYDRVDAVVRSVITRRDAAKSLWTTVAAAVWQTAWAIAGFVCGIPGYIWLAAAILTAAIALAYLYRQITLAKIRELRNSSTT